MIAGFEKVVLDIGTGDGRFILRSALARRDEFFIGVDANAKPLQKISVKTERTLGKRGRANAIFVRASAEDLPCELHGIADLVCIYFPWGSLLGAVLRADTTFLTTIQQILRTGGDLRIVTSIDAKRDRGEMDRLGLDALSASDLASVLEDSYRNAGFAAVEVKETQNPDQLPDTTWAKKLRGSQARLITILQCRRS